MQLRPEPVVEPPLHRPNLKRAIQVPLFQDRPASNVIPFESYAPVEPKPRQRSASTAPRRAPRRPVPEEQGKLDFLPPAPPKPRTLGTTVEAVIFCDAPVASCPHRVIAGALDWSIVMIAYGLFVAVYALMGGGFVFNKGNVALLGAVLPLFGAVYGALWAWAGKEPIGMQWAKLHLLTFDGFPPDRKQRLMRLAGSALSLLSFGLGLLWSLVDEESLGWHDHISRTFPTPVGLEDQILRRR